ncbi:MAG TPA: SHOCT domain-containing protein [Acidimicrobiales bacterium]|jgi:putative membrane protein|nr:SHOCT domain-containing protein [Acidimicrobiales bacterium]
MMWYWGGGMQWWGWLVGFLAMVLFWGAVIWGIWYLATGFGRRHRPEQRSGGAKGILDERLARGEIDPEEYRRLRDLLSADDEGRTGETRPRAGTGDRR